MVSTGDILLIKDRRIRELLFQIYVVAQKYGISPNHYKGQYNVSSELSTSDFFADPKAYVYLASFVENKEILLESYANNLSIETKGLRGALEKYTSSR